MQIIDFIILSILVTTVIILVFAIIGNELDSYIPTFIGSIVTIFICYFLWGEVHDKKDVDCLNPDQYQVIETGSRIIFEASTFYLISNDLYVYKNARDTSRVKVCRIRYINKDGDTYNTTEKILMVRDRDEL